MSNRVTIYDGLLLPQVCVTYMFNKLLLDGGFVVI